MAAQRSEHLLTAGSGGKSGRQRRGNPGATSAKSETRRPRSAGNLRVPEPPKTNQGSISFISTKTGATSIRIFCRSAARATRAGSFRNALRF